MPSSPKEQLSSPHTDYVRTLRAQPTQYIAGHSTTTYVVPHGIKIPAGTSHFTENAYPDKAGPKPREAPLRVTEPCPPNTVSSSLANARMPPINTGHPAPDNTTHSRTWGTIRTALHQDIDGDPATWLYQGSITLRAGGWPDSLILKNLRRALGPSILYPVPHGMDGPCKRLRTGDPPCGHPCTHSLFKPLPPQPAPLQRIYLNTIPGD